MLLLDFFDFVAVPQNLILDRHVIVIIGRRLWLLLPTWVSILQPRGLVNCRGWVHSLHHVSLPRCHSDWLGIGVHLRIVVGLATRSLPQVAVPTLGDLYRFDVGHRSVQGLMP